jgi:hypothetical protein
MLNGTKGFWGERAMDASAHPICEALRHATQMWRHKNRKEDDMERTFDQETVVALPDRAALSLVNANLALPINLALAANVLSDGAVAAANAEQVTPINQGMFTNPVTL